MREPDLIPQLFNIQIGDENGKKVISSTDSGVTIEVNEDGLAVIKLIDGKHSIRDIANDLRCNYEDILPYFEELQKLGLVGKREGEQSLPANRHLTVEWDITYKCNLLCTHCMVEAGNYNKHYTSAEMSTALAKQFCEDVAKAGFHVLIISGGEPLMREDWAIILQHAVRQNLYTKLMSNGALLTDKYARQLSDLGVIYVQISLDGPEASIHDKLRGSGAFNDTLRGLCYLRENKIPFGIGTIIFRDNENRLKEMAKLAYELGANAWLPGELLQKGRACESWNDLQSTRQWIDIEKEIFQLSREYEGKIRINSYIRSLRMTYNLASQGLLSRACSRVYTGFSIAPDGSFSFCKGFFGKCDLAATLESSTYRIGRYPQMSIQELVDLRDKFLMDLAKREGTKCSDCALWTYCLGGCAAENFERYRKFLVPSGIECHNIPRVNQIKELI